MNNPVLRHDATGKVAIIDDLVLLGVGALRGLGEQLVSDVATSIATGHWKVSSLEDCGASVASGAVTTWLDEYSLGLAEATRPALKIGLKAFARGGIEFVNQGIEIATGHDNGRGFDFGKIGLEMASGALGDVMFDELLKGSTADDLIRGQILDRGVRDVLGKNYVGWLLKDVTKNEIGHALGGGVWSALMPWNWEKGTSETNLPPEVDALWRSYLVKRGGQ